MHMNIDQADNSSNAPETVHASPRLILDLKALSELTNYETPPMRLLQGINISQALYWFGNASKGGFGLSFSTHKGSQYHIGVWGHSLSQNSSNWHELRNLVDSLEDEGKAGHLKGIEVFLFTNSKVCKKKLQKIINRLSFI
eukprot:9185968-Ditylum_brightwellii.AAC.1